MTGKSNFPFSWEDLQKRAKAVKTQEDLCCGSPSAWLLASALCIRESEDLRVHRSVVWRVDAYVKVVLQGFWSGSITGGEAKVVLKGVFVGQKLL